MEIRATVCGGLIMIAASPPVLSQCTLQALPGIGVPGTDGPVVAVQEWDPDGAGPMPPWIVFGGWFTIGGDRNAPNLVAYEAATDTWRPLATSIDGKVSGLAVLPSGELVVVGLFEHIDGVPVDRVATFDGTTWASVGGGVDGTHAWCEDCAVLANGHLVVTGGFTSAGGTPTQNIAEWDGSAWQSMGGGLPGNYGTCLEALPNGDLIAGGTFQFAGSALVNGLARWDGATWSTIGNGSDRVAGDVADIQRLDNGDLAVCGSIGHVGTQTSDNLYIWNGTSWSSTGMFNHAVESLVVDADGDLIASGRFTAVNAVAAHHLARWDGSTWDAAGGCDEVVSAWCRASSGAVYAGGLLYQIDGRRLNNVARYDNSQWQPLHGGLDRHADDVVLARDGSVLVAGRFASADGMDTGGLARFANGAWHRIGNVDLQEVTAVHERSNGDIVAASRQLGLLRWNGTDWASLGASSGIEAIVEAQGGDLIVAGPFAPLPPMVGYGIQRLTAAGWQPLGGGVSGYVHDAVILPDGDVVVGGQLQTAGGQPATGAARWDGSGWHALGSGPQGSVFCLLVTASGQLVAGGDYLQFWDGSSWTQSAPFTGTIEDLAETPDGDLLACGRLALPGDTQRGRVLRWDGASWSEVAEASIQDPFWRNAENVHAMAFDRDGRLALAGSFMTIDGVPSPYFGHVASTCSALAAPLGSGCTSTAGAVTLTNDSLPWLGAICRSTATGVPTNAAAVVVHGLAPAQLPLPSLLPFALAGCDLLATPDLVGLELPDNHRVTITFAVPLASALIGAQLHQQVLPFEFGIDQLTASNALQLTFGSF